MEKLCTVIEAVQKQLDELDKKERVIAAIDGRCGAGKTTLAEQLRKRNGFTVLHMDDFFLRPEQRVPERWDKPGENVDHERFLEEVLIPLTKGESFSYRPFDCHTQDFKEPVEVRPARITIVEGSYSCHPDLWGYYDLHIFLTIDKNEQLRRLTERGRGSIEMFRNRWIPLEEEYFSAFQIEKRCELRFTMEDNAI